MLCYKPENLKAPPNSKIQMMLRGRVIDKILKIKVFDKINMQEGGFIKMI